MTLSERKYSAFVVFIPDLSSSGLNVYSTTQALPYAPKVWGTEAFLSQFFPWNTHRHDVKNQKRWGTCPPPSHLVAESMLNHLQCVGVKTQNKKHDFSKTTSNVQKVKSQMPTSDTNTPHNYLISMIVDFK